MLEVNNYMCSFDLRNQFFHVQLHLDMYRFFGFAISDCAGRERYYFFKVLIYRVKPAVYIVTHLLAPVKSYLHALGVKLSIYVDDGRVAAATADETLAKTNLTLLVLQLAGWNIQWKKCSLQPAQKLLHLGFFTDTCSMLYSVPEEKIMLLKSLISVICKLYMDNACVSAKLMATVLGKIMSMLRSYGDILRIMSRASQHVLGVQTLQFGWSVCFPVTVHIFTELSFIRDILDSHNGQPIFTAAAHVHTIELQQIADLVSKIEHSVCPMENLFVSDASASHAFVYNADGSFHYVRDFEFTASQACSSSGHREL